MWQEQKVAHEPLGECVTDQSLLTKYYNYKFKGFKFGM